MRMSAEQNQIGKVVKSGVIERFREGKKLRDENRDMVQGALKNDELVAWSDILLSIGALLLALTVLSAIAFTLPIMQLFF